MRLGKAHRRAARYLMMGMRKSHVAKKVGASSGAVVSNWCKDMDFARYLQYLEESCFEDLDREIRWLKTTAVKVIKESLMSRVVEDRRWAVEKVLIMSGHHEKVTHEHRGKIIHEEAPMTPKAKKLAKAFLTETRESVASSNGSNGKGH